MPWRSSLCESVRCSQSFSIYRFSHLTRETDIINCGEFIIEYHMELCRDMSCLQIQYQRYCAGMQRQLDEIYA
jgi:hypothetical protein